MDQLFSNTVLYSLALIVGVLVFLTWVMKRQEKNYANHIGKTKQLYDEQREFSKVMAEDSQLLLKKMLNELEAIKNLLAKKK